MTTRVQRSGSKAPSIAPSGQFVAGPLGIQLHTRAFGDPTATHKVLCIHGGMQAKECFWPQYAGLAPRDCLLVGVDLPYHGQSELGPGQEGLAPTPELWSDSIDAVRRHYGLQDQPVTLLGWSMAGLPIRNYLQLRGTAGIAGIILVATTLDFSTFIPMLVQQASETMEVMARLTDTRLSASQQHEAVRSFVDMLFYIPPTPEQYYQTLGYNFLSHTKSGQVMGDILASQAAGDTAELLARLDCPVLLVRGQEDALVPLSMFRQFVGMLKQEQERVFEPAGVGHSPFLEVPELFNEAVLDFLEGPVRRFVADTAHHNQEG